jgi:hypothetical protein
MKGSQIEVFHERSSNANSPITDAGVPLSNMTPDRPDLPEKQPGPRLSANHGIVISDSSQQQCSDVAPSKPSKQLSDCSKTELPAPIKGAVMLVPLNMKWPK